jgi:hypothetical protein
MRMSDRLARSLANIDAYVVAVRHAVRFDVTPNRRKQSPNGSLFVGGKGKKISFVPPRNNQAGSRI